MLERVDLALAVDSAAVAEGWYDLYRLIHSFHMAICFVADVDRFATQHVSVDLRAYFLRKPQEERLRLICGPS